MRTLVFLLSATILAIQFERVYSQCHLCVSEDIAIQNPNARIPLLRIPGPIPTTCQVAYNYGKIIDASDPACEQLRQQSVYCQCSNTEIVSPGNACGLCNGESVHIMIMSRLITNPIISPLDQRWKLSTTSESNYSVW